jgi:hypothetical protein
MKMGRTVGDVFVRASYEVQIILCHGFSVSNLLMMDDVTY